MKKKPATVIKIKTYHLYSHKRTKPTRFKHINFINLLSEKQTIKK